MATTYQVSQEVYIMGVYGPKKTTITRTVTDHKNDTDKYNVDGEPLNKFFSEEDLSEDESGIIDIFTDKVGDL